MLMTVVSALVESLVKYTAKNFFNNISGVKIEGAPSWYMQPVNGKSCVYVYDHGDYTSIDRAKRKAKIKMEKKINGLIDVVIYQNAPKFNFSKEIALMRKFKKDENLDLFVEKNLKYDKIQYYKDKKETFLRACIDSDELIGYEKKRLEEIRENVLHYKVDSAFDELQNFPHPTLPAK